ncbi:MAG TPA: cation:proton antiporter subunit C [Terriglobales bacterium]|jgi:multicomponent Na+:H+ antiporter subunit C|nr:cation:proton antiporter subunit C [Terriglobales bacterium]
MAYFMFAVAAWIFLWGLYGIISSRNLVHQCISLVILQTSTYVLLLGIGFRTGATAPVFADIPVGTPVVDPIVQSLMLTDVVVEATVLALLLAMVVKANELAGTVDPEELRVLTG